MAMSYRLTETEKWNDKWFRKLPPYQKLLFNYICDACDIAGFWEIDLELAAEKTLIPPLEIEVAFNGIRRAFIASDNFVWVVNFLKHQKNIPLNTKNPCHKGIIHRIRNHKELGQKVLDAIGMEDENKAPSKPLPSPFQAPSKGHSNVKYSNSNIQGECEGGVIVKNEQGFILPQHNPEYMLILSEWAQAIGLTPKKILYGEGFKKDREAVERNVHRADWCIAAIKKFTGVKSHLGALIVHAENENFTVPTARSRDRPTCACGCGEPATVQIEGIWYASDHRWRPKTNKNGPGINERSASRANRPKK